MKLAWLSKLPTMGVPMRGEGGTTLLTDKLPKSAWVLPSATFAQESQKPAEKPGVWARMMTGLKQQFSFKLPTIKPLFSSSPILLPEAKKLKENIETYAESPFEKELFSLTKKPKAYVVSKAWVQALKSPQPETREAALTLLKAYFAYSSQSNTEQLSPHTHMKLMLFAPHLSEGPFGKAILLEALLKLPLPQLLEFGPVLKKEFSSLPPIAQALILKQLLSLRKNLALSAQDGKDPGEHLVPFKKLVKSLVIQFYTNKKEVLTQIFGQQEKIRVGFLKFHPIEDAYRKQLEEIERKYRLKLRQLKKRRAQKVAEAEEEKLRRIELIYETVEGNLVSGLNELNLGIEEVLAI